MTRRTALFSRLAVLAAFSICAIPAGAGTTSTTGGTITFVGSIVAPPYEVQMVAAALSSTRSASTEGAEISFSSSPGQSARVRADGLDNLPLAVRCTDAKPMPAGGCRLGPRGGTLSVATQSVPAARVARGAILTVAYD